MLKWNAQQVWFSCSMWLRHKNPPNSITVNVYAPCGLREQGLDVLITCGSISATPVGIATFVIEAQQHALPTKTVCSILTPQRFAGVLSSEAAWKAAKPTAVAYLKSYDFTGLSLCQALRTLLWRTSVPQSTRSVSFLLRMFSARYFETAVNNDETLKLYFPDHGEPDWPAQCHQLSSLSISRDCFQTLCTC